MNIFKKKLTVPVNNETKEIDVIQTWEVRWMSRDGSYSCDVKPQVEVFLLEQSAIDFKNSLVAAAKLIRNTNDIKISIHKNTNS